MPVTIIAGRAGSGKSAVLYKKINELSKRNIGAVLLVPEQFTLQAEHELIASGKNSGFISVNVMSISRLAKDIFSSVYNPNKTLIDERGKAAALSMVAFDMKEELKVFGRAASFTGFASDAAALISDFKKFDITPESLGDAAQKIDSLSSDKISDLSKIYSSFERFLKEKEYMDADDQISILAQTLLTAAQYKDSHFFIDGFDALTSQDLKIARALLSLSGHLTVCINYVKGENEDVFYSGEKALSDLIDTAKILGHQYEVIYAENPHVKKHPSINHLEKNLFSQNPEPFTGKSSIKIFEATSTQEEAEHIACQILNLIKKDSSIKFSDISILCCSDLNTYGPLFERMFLRYGISCFTHKRKAIAQHPAVSYILSAIAAKLYGMPKSEILAMLKSGYANIDYEDAMLFEDYVLDNAIDNYLFLRKLQRGAKKYNLEKINEIRQKLVAPLSLISSKMLPAKKHLESIFHLIKTVNLKQSLLTERALLLENSVFESAALASQVYNSIISILDQLNFLFEDKAVSLEQILFALEESFINTQLGLLPVSSDEVLIGELGRTKLAETKYLFVVGANESSLPPSNQQSPILSDLDIDALAELGIDFMKSKKAKRSSVDFSIYQSFSLPSNGLYLSYSCNGADGANPPSIILKQIEELFNIQAEKAVIDYTVSKAAALSFAAKAFGAIGDGRIPPDNWKQAISALIHKKQCENELDKMRMFLSVCQQAPGIAPKNENIIISSVSQIEQYAGCPFSYMVKYSLRPKDEPGEEITPAGEGAFLHEAMERFGLELTQHDIAGLSVDEIETIMQKEAQIIAQNFDLQRLSRDAKGKYQAGNLIKKAKHGAVIYTQHLNNSKFVPLGQEIEFGDGKGLGPIEISLENGAKVKIVGKVDRLDTFDTSHGELARIVDYKSSVNKIDYSKIESGRQLQLLIYMDAYLSKNRNVHASGVFYFPLRKNYIDEDKNEKRNDKMQGLFIDSQENVEALDKDITELGFSKLINAKRKKDGDFDKNSDNISKEGFEHVLCYAKNKAKDILKSMDQGEIPVRPVKNVTTSQCKYCDFSSICKKDINLLEEKLELDKQTAKNIVLGEDDG